METAPQSIKPSRFDADRVGKKLVSWAALVAFATLPILFRVSTAVVTGKGMTLESLFGNGELLIVAAAISAAGVVDLFDRKLKDGEMTATQRGAIVIAILFAFLSANAYKDIKADNIVNSSVESVQTSSTSQGQTESSAGSKNTAETQRKLNEEREKAKAEARHIARRNATASLIFYGAALIIGAICAIMSTRLVR